MKSPKRNAQNLKLKEENSSHFYSWGLQLTVVKMFVFFVAIKRHPSLRAIQLAYVEKVHPPLLVDDGGVVIVGLLILWYQSDCWQAGLWHGSGGVVAVSTCLKTCLELPKSRYLILSNSNLMDQFEGSRRFDDHQWNSSATRESSRVIILKSRLNSTGHSACTSEVRDIFDRQTYVPMTDDSWCAWMFFNLDTAAI